MGLLKKYTELPYTANEKTSAVYSIVNTINNKVYVGGTNRLSNRWYCHIWQLLNGTHDNPILQKAVQKYGLEAFKFNIVEMCTEDNVFIREEYWMKELQCHDLTKGYNLRQVSECRNGKMSEDSKQRMRNAQKNRVISKAQVDKLRNTASLRRGKPIILLSITGEYITEMRSLGDVAEFLHGNRRNIANIQSALKGRNGTTSVKGYIAVYKSEYDPNKVYGTDYNKRSIEKYTLDNVFIEKYESIAAAARSICVTKDCLHHAIKNKEEREYRGFIWKKQQKLSEKLNETAIV